MSNNQFINQIDEIVEEYHLLKHPFYQAWNEGRLSIESLQDYAKQYYHHVEAFPTYLSAVHAQTEDMNTRKHILQNLFEEPVGESFLNRKIRYLSGGQKQRLNLLRALVLEVPVIILDEPLNGLDFKSIMRVIDLLVEKKKAGSGILLISHNEEIFDSIIKEQSIYYLGMENKSSG